MTNFDFSNTTDQIADMYGEEQRLYVSSAIHSVIQRENYARFHYWEVKRIIDEYVANDINQKNLIQKISSQDSDSQDFHTKLGAHLLGCIQSLHAIADIASHATYYSLGLNKGESPLKEREVTHQKVTKKIKDIGKFKQVHFQLETLIESLDYKHIEALANYGKHRSIIAIGLIKDQTGLAAERYSIQFDAFKYNDVEYEKTDASSLIEREFDRLSEVILSLVREINNVVVASAGSSL